MLKFRRTLSSVAAVVIVGVGTAISAPTPAHADSVGPLNFEAYSLGTVNAQDGWSSLGAAGSGCAMYDHAISNNALLPGAPPSFGTRSLRISNGVTSGCFGDQTFSKPTVDEAGETAAVNNGLSGGTRQSSYHAKFSLASVTPAAEQAGLIMSIAPDRGDGARMSYLRFEDSPLGFNVFFDDYQDAAPFGSTGNLAAGCGVEDDFIETQVATGLTRSPHTFGLGMQLIDGQRNDVVTVAIDGVIVHTGTSWEDYFRYCEASDTTRTVDSMLFRTGGTAAPANLGGGFLVDGLTVTTSVMCSAACYVSPTGDDSNSGLANAPMRTIQHAIDTVAAGGTVNVRPGNYDETAANRSPVSIGGTYNFGLFISKNNVTVQGVTAADVPITNANSVLAHITTNSDANFGPDGIFVEGDGDSIRGLGIGANNGGGNKTIEVLGDGFTLNANNIEDYNGSVYFNDARYDQGTNTPHVSTYAVTNNHFQHGVSLDITSGTGGGVAAAAIGGRVITGNTFDGDANPGPCAGAPNNCVTGEVYWPAVSFNGAGTAITWFKDPVGAATITGNTFGASDQYIRHRHGTPDSAVFSNWSAMWSSNTFPRAAIDTTNGNAASPRSYTYGSFPLVERIGGTLNTAHAAGCGGADCNGEITNAVGGDTVLAKGSFTGENVTLNTNKTLQGVGVTTLTGAGVAVNINGAATATGLTISGYATGVTMSAGALGHAVRNSLAGNAAGLASSTPGSDATCNWWGSASGPAPYGSGASIGNPANATFTPFLGTSNLAGVCAGNVGAPVISVGSLTIPEGNAGNHIVNVPVTLSHPSLNTVTVLYSTRVGSATITGSDFTAASFQLLTFAPGVTTQNAPVTVNGDLTAEKYESFYLDATNPSNATLLGGGVKTTGTITLQNDDLPKLTANSISVSESATPASVTLKINFPYYQPIVVNLSTLNGTAISPGDFANFAPGATVTFPAGSTTAIVVLVSVNLDSVIEAQEKFTVVADPVPVGMATKNVTVTIAANVT